MDTKTIENFTLENELLIIGNDTLNVKNVSKDSLVFSYYADYERDIIFKKLKPKTQKKLPQIANKAFELAGPNYLDSLDFLNDSALLHLGNNYNNDNRVSNWTLYTYKSFNFLILDDFKSTTFLIEEYNNQEINLKLFGPRIKNFKLTKINNLTKDINLSGYWVSPFDDNNNLPVPPPYPSPEDSIDSQLYLKFEKDSLFIKQYNEIKVMEWKLNSTNRFIYFPLNEDSINEIWKIIYLDSDKLEIEELHKFYSPNEIKKRTFKKMKNGW